MAENAEFKFEIDLRPCGKIESFHNKEEFQKWLKIEADFWNWGDILKAKDQQADNFLISIKGRINSIQSLFDRTVSSQGDPSTFRNQLELLKNLVLSCYKDNQLLHSSVPESKFIKDIKEKDPVRALYVLKYFVDRKFEIDVRRQTYNREQFEGAFTALLFRSGIKGAGEAEKAALKELRDLWQTHFNQSKDELNKVKEQYDNLLKEYTGQKENQKNIFEDLLVVSKKEHQKTLDETKKNLHELMELYRSKLGLHSAIEYWETKAKSHQKLVKSFSLAVILCFILAGIGLFVSIRMFIGEDTIQNIKLWKLGGLILGATILVWVLRVLIRLLLSNCHLMSDANERRTMLLTYLALQQENRLPQGDAVHLILQALFRPSSIGIIKDDAVPPFMAAWLKKVTGDD